MKALALFAAEFGPIVRDWDAIDTPYVATDLVSA
jgi:hypothetical protein